MKDFFILLDSAADLAVNILDAVEFLALFLARAVVDDILPPAFLTTAKKEFPKSSKGFQVIQTAEKSYLSAPNCTELVKRKWGGCTDKDLEEVNTKIDNFLGECMESGYTREALKSLRELEIPLYHHEVVRSALILIMLTGSAELVKVLEAAAKEGVISSTQIVRGFSLLAPHMDDLAHSLPNAKTLFNSLLAKSLSEGWLPRSFTSMRFVHEIVNALVVCGKCIKKLGGDDIEQGKSHILQIFHDASHHMFDNNYGAAWDLFHEGLMLYPNNMLLLNGIERCMEHINNPGSLDLGQSGSVDTGLWKWLKKILLAPRHLELTLIIADFFGVGVVSLVMSFVLVVRMLRSIGHQTGARKDMTYVKVGLNLISFICSGIILLAKDTESEVIQSIELGHSCLILPLHVALFFYFVSRLGYSYATFYEMV